MRLRLLLRVVLVHKAVLGGEHAGKPGRGSEDKAPFMVAVEFDDERLRYVFASMPSTASKA